jgi:hypothetical protein
MQMQQQLLQFTPEAMYPPQQQRVLLQLTVQQPGLVTVQLTVLQDVQGDGVPGIGCAVHQPISPAALTATAFSATS